jgi:hypothetical protein
MIRSCLSFRGKPEAKVLESPDPGLRRGDG